MKTIDFNTALTPQIRRRLAYVALIAIALGAAFAFISLRNQAQTRANEAATNAAWRSAPALSTPSATPSADAVFARFNIRRNAANAASGAAGGNDELVWQAANAAELRASLVSLDAAKVALRQVKITRSGTSFAVTAERAP